MTTPKLVITILTVAALGATPAVASGGTKCHDGSGCRIAVNHNEVLVASTAG